MINVGIINVCINISNLYRNKCIESIFMILLRYFYKIYNIIIIFFIKKYRLKYEIINIYLSLLFKYW